MAAQAAEKLKKVQRYSTSLRRLFRFLFVLTALALLVETYLTLMGVEPFRAGVRIGSTQYSGDAVSATVRAIAYAQFVLSSLLVLKLNFHLAKLFGLYANAQIFSAANVKEIRQIGVTVLLFPALWLLSLLVPALLPAEGTSQTIVGGMPFMQIIVGTVVIVVSWIMDVGRELREEQELVV